jgi:hypothetical protein
MCNQIAQNRGSDTHQSRRHTRLYQGSNSDSIQSGSSKGSLEKLRRGGVQRVRARDGELRRVLPPSTKTQAAQDWTASFTAY